MSEIEISKIKWGDRTRADYGDIQELASSIQSIGLIQPIVLDENDTLLAGGRRVTACILIKKTHIPFVRLSELSPLQKFEVELEENIRRKNFTWDEEIKLKQTIINLKTTLHPDWSATKVNEETAKTFGQSMRTVQRDISLASALERHPELSKEKEKHTALSKVKRMQDIKLREIALSTSPTLEDDIRMGDARELIKTIPDRSVDLILFDPPFGVDYTNEDRLKSYTTIYGDLKDAPDDIYKLNEEIISHFPRIMKLNAHCYIFCSSSTLLRYNLYHLFSKYLTVPPQFLLWTKMSGDNKNPYFRFTINYEPFFFAHLKEPKRLNSYHVATFAHNALSSTAKQHPAEKPLSLYKELIELSSIKGEVVFDPMMGSGNSLVAAKMLGRRVIGFECIKEWFDLASFNLLHVEDK